MRKIVFAAFLVSGGCATTPASMLALADADGSKQRLSAVQQASSVAANPRHRPSVRISALQTIGRLRQADKESAQRIGKILSDRRAGQDIRCASAWALGQMRSDISLNYLVNSLRSPMNAELADYVMQGLARHSGVLAQQPESMVRLVESMVFFAGNSKEQLPAIYDLLGTKTRTIEVNITVLNRAVDAYKKQPNKNNHAALYNAAYELLDSLDSQREEVVAGPAKWKTRIEEAFIASQGAFSAQEWRVALLVLWSTGKLSSLPEYARPAAKVLVGSRGEAKGRPTLWRSPALRLATVWALARMQLHSQGARRALVQDVFPGETNQEILELVADISSGDREPDLIQKVLGIGGES